MKFMKFDYVDAKGRHTTRDVAVMYEASNNLFALDVAELDVHEQAQFAVEYNRLLEIHQEALDKLLMKHDLKNSMRYFVPNKMTNITTEYL